jgi:hypothetical protein
MPVIECSCGMVMSVSVAEPRNKCIRCSGVEFRELRNFKPIVTALNCAPLAPITTGRNGRLGSPVATAGRVVSRIAAGISL